MQKIKTTGQLRDFLAASITDLAAGKITVESAQAIFKLSKNITESLYSETKIAMFMHDTNQEQVGIGSFPIGDTETDDAREAKP